MAACGSAGSSMCKCFARSWRQRDDRTAHRCADLAGLWRHGSAQWLRWACGARADAAVRARLLRSGVCFSWSARRPDQTAVVGRRRSVFVLQATRTWAICVAAGDERNGASDAGSTVDVARGDRLATTSTDSLPATLRVVEIAYLYRCFIKL